MPLRETFDPQFHLSKGDVLDTAISPVKHQRVRDIDPFLKGVLVYLGRTGNDLYPVGTVAAHLAVWGRAPGPFFKLALVQGVAGELVPSSWLYVSWSLQVGPFFKLASGPFVKGVAGE